MGDWHNLYIAETEKVDELARQLLVALAENAELRAENETLKCKPPKKAKHE